MPPGPEDPAPVAAPVHTTAARGGAGGVHHGTDRQLWVDEQRGAHPARCPGTLADPPQRRGGFAGWYAGFEHHTGSVPWAVGQSGGVPVLWALQ